MLRIQTESLTIRWVRMNWSRHSVQWGWLAYTDLCCASGAGSYSSHLVPDEAAAAAEREVSWGVFVCLRDLTQMTKKNKNKTVFCKTVHVYTRYRHRFLLSSNANQINKLLSKSSWDTKTRQPQLHITSQCIYLMLGEKGAACTHSTVPSGMYVQIYASGRHWKPFPCSF